MRLLLTALTLPVLAACGSPGGESGPADEAGAPVSSSPINGFPVLIQHAYGTTTIEKQPTRVVTAGSTEQDTVLALGVTPVGVTQWYGDYPYAAWPWAQKALGDAEPLVLNTNDGFEFEKIAGLRPDLIIATNAGLEKDDYEKLSAIAPTIAHSGKYTKYFEPWDVQAVAAGRALGRQQEIQTIVDKIKNDFTNQAAAHPEFSGKKIVFLQNAFYNGAAIAYPNGLSTEFLTQLGFVIPASLNAFTQGEEQASIPLAGSSPIAAYQAGVR